jgi:hypothetical protein
LQHPERADWGTDCADCADWGRFRDDTNFCKYIGWFE